MTCALYRHFDASGSLLYVGIASNVLRRSAQHTESGWFSDISTITVQHFSSRSEAEAAETEAIRSERPKYNIKGAIYEGENAAREFVSKVTVPVLMERLRLGRTSISNAVARGKFPACWAMIIAHISRELDIHCPMRAFGWSGNSDPDDDRPIADVMGIARQILEDRIRTNVTPIRKDGAA